MTPIRCASGHILADAETPDDIAKVIAHHANAEHGRHVSAQDIAAALYRVEGELVAS